MLNEILTLEEVAKYLRLDKKTIYRLVKSGKLPAFKAGSKWRFHRIDIERYVTYKYNIFGKTGVRSNFYKSEVLQRYLDNREKYYIFDEAFSGKLGLKALYQEWKEGKISDKDNFLEIPYKKVRLNLAPPSQPYQWALLVVIDPAYMEKIMSNNEEYKHWEKYAIHHLSFPSSDIVR